MKYKVNTQLLFEIDHNEYVKCFISKVNNDKRTYEIKVPNQESWLLGEEGLTKTHTYGNVSHSCLKESD